MKQKFFSERGVAMVVEVITASVAVLAISASIYFVVQNHHKTKTVTPAASSSTSAPAATTTPKTQPYVVYIKSTVGLRLRSAKDDSSTANVIATMPFDSQATVDDDSDSTWDHGTYSGKTGYFSKALVVKNEADVTADWKTYHANREGLSFKYPADWTVKPGTNTAKDWNEVSTDSIQLVSSDKFNFDFFVRLADGLGGVCDNCATYGATSIAIPGYGSVTEIMNGDDKGVINDIGLARPGATNSPGNVYYYYESKNLPKVSDAPEGVWFYGAFGTLGSGNVISLPKDVFLAKSSVKVAQKIFRTITYQ